MVNAFKISIAEPPLLIPVLDEGAKVDPLRSSIVSSTLAELYAVIRSSVGTLRIQPSTVAVHHSAQILHALGEVDPGCPP